MARNLETIWKILELIKVFFGLTILENPRHARTQKLFLAFLFSCLLAFYLNTLFTLWTSTETAWKVYYGIILIGMTGYMSLMSYFLLTIETYENTLQWCEDLHSCNFGNSEAMKKCKTSSTKAYVLFGLVVPATSLMVLLLQMVFLSVYRRKMSNPFMVAVPFGTDLEEILTTMFHLGICAGALLSSSATLSLIVGVNLHFIAWIEMEMDLSRKITPQLTRKQFDERVREIVDLHCELIERQVVFSHFASVQMLMIETLTFFMLLMAWIITFFVKELSFLACGAIPNAYVYVVPCIITELLSNSLGDFQDMIYDVKWYEMSPKKRKVLLQIMVMANRKNLLRCGPFYVINYEALTNLLRRVYNCGLIINALVDPKSLRSV